MEDGNIGRTVLLVLLKACSSLFQETVLTKTESSKFSPLSLENIEHWWIGPWHHVSMEKFVSKWSELKRGARHGTIFGPPFFTYVLRTSETKLTTIILRRMLMIGWCFAVTKATISRWTYFMGKDGNVRAKFLWKHVHFERKQKIFHFTLT